MPLPQERDQTVLPGDPVPSELLNRLQDQIVAGAHGNITDQIPLFDATIYERFRPRPDGGLESTGQTGAAAKALIVRHGDVITQFAARASDTGITGKIKLMKRLPGQPETVVATLAQFPAAERRQAQELHEPVAAGAVYWVFIETGAGNGLLVVQGVELGRYHNI